MRRRVSQPGGRVGAGMPTSAKAMKSSGSRTKKTGIDMATRSVSSGVPAKNLTASPRASVARSRSRRSPDPLLKRMSTGICSPLKCLAAHRRRPTSLASNQPTAPMPWRVGRPRPRLPVGEVLLRAPPPADARASMISRPRSLDRCVRDPGSSAAARPPLDDRQTVARAEVGGGLQMATGVVVARVGTVEQRHPPVEVGAGHEQRRRERLDEPAAPRRTIDPRRRSARGRARADRGTVRPSRTSSWRCRRTGRGTAAAPGTARRTARGP